MKITRLRMAGFGPYRTEQVIDFTSFDDDGIFLITGKTGAGKSSILDAICYALYDQVPRYDQRAAQLRSDHCEPTDPTFVELEFTLADHLHRVHRTPKFERPKQRGDGMAISQPTAQLSRADGDDWRVVAVGQRDVGVEIARILPIRADQFLQVILLAQNRFQQFLLAKTDERRAVLRTLFGTDRFERLETGLTERHRALTLQVQGITQRIDVIATAAQTLVTNADSEADADADADNDADADADASREAKAETPDVASLEWFSALMIGLAARRERASTVAQEAAELLAGASADHRSAEHTRARQERRRAASDRLASFEASAAEIAASRVELEAAARALRAWPFVESTSAARRLLVEADQSAAVAMAAWSARSDTGEDVVDHPTLDRLLDMVDAWLAERGSLSDVLVDEHRLIALEQHSTKLDAAEAEALERVEQHRSRLAAVPAELDAIARQIEECAATAALLEPARATEARVAQAVVAAHTVERVEVLHAAALLSQKRASSAGVGAAVAYDTLLDRRLSGHAAELAGALVAGEACAVCGSTTHPLPAESDAAPVTEADIGEASTARIDTQAAVAGADAEVQRLAAELERARGSAGDTPLTVLLADYEQAKVHSSLATAALSTLSTLETQRSQLTADRTAIEARMVDLSTRLDAARRALGDHRAVVTAIRGRVASNLAGFASIEQRMSSLDIRLLTARTLAEAQDRAADALTALDVRTANLASQLAEIGFEGVADVERARRDQPEIAGLERRIRTHDDGVAAARSVLNERDMQDLPSDMVDLEYTRIALESATAERDTATSTAHAIEARYGQLSALVTDVTALITTSRDLVTEHSQVRDLAELIAGKGSNTRRIRLETYVLAARLEQIILAANVRLDTMTGGRYSLELDDGRQHRDAETGLGLSIRDAHTGRARATHSLSGGETFLASLALALGLAEVVSNQAGGIALDTLFVDEGFGSLDSETLDIAMSTLDGLRAGGRTVGLISHVDSMKEQIPAKLHVSVSPTGGSRIDQRTSGGD